MDMLLGLDMLKRHQVIKSTHTSNNVSMYVVISYTYLDFIFHMGKCSWAIVILFVKS